MAIKIFLRESPQRAIALGTNTHVLIFRHNPSATGSTSTTSLSDASAPRCIVEFAPWGEVDMKDYRSLPSLDIKGTLGLITINGDVFICVVTHSKRTATVRADETVQQILGVDFHCLTRGDYDSLLYNQINPFPTDDLEPDGFDRSAGRDSAIEHPCMAMKKLLSAGTFYYSSNFDLTKRLQDRPAERTTVAIDSLNNGFLWNTFMIQPLVEFRSKLSEREKEALDQSGILTSAMRGFAATHAVPPSSSPLHPRPTGMPSTMTLISRLSCRRAGTRFNARGIDDDGNVANFVETETIFNSEQFCFSYVQTRGSVPVFWEQSSGLPGQQKIQITRSPEATKPAFDKHFDMLAKAYGDIFVVNLLSGEKPSENQLIQLYNNQIDNSQLNERSEKQGETASSEHRHLKAINFDFHAETRGAAGYDAAVEIKRWIKESALSFEYYLTEDISEVVTANGHKQTVFGQNEVLKQNGIFRTNCLDCLDRTNVVQTVISQMMVETFLVQQGANSPTSDFWARHGTLWADCGDALSKIYAGTGALKSSFTRSGKHSLAGMFADARKSVQRLYINNFEDKGRQTIIDMVLGRLIGQAPVTLFDPINDYVTAEANRRAVEYTSSEQINLWIGTFNMNGKCTGMADDLTPWLCPKLDKDLPLFEIYAVAFQEIVDLDVQQIVSTDPHRRHDWEEAVRKTLNSQARKYGSEEYVLLRSGQLVGASLSIFVKTSQLPFIKNVEGAVKKTGMSGMAGNKGAVAIRMDYADTSICLVTAHLAAGFANYDERNQDYRTISQGLRFQRDRSIEDHKTVIWFGDFNYRIGIDNDRARQLIKTRDLGTLYENDQLNLQMVHGKVFPHYSETAPTFLPTYKLNLGTDEYDTSEKARIPAWTDRILTRGDNLRQLYYNSAPLRFSDHRPVYGIFRCTISVVDQAKKDSISAELYAKRREVVGGRTANSQGDNDSDDESLYGYESVEPGLPPASSDKRKWWLDNGTPATSEIKAPSSHHMPNPKRLSNPFTPSAEPDWVKVEKPVGTAGPTKAAPASLDRIPSQTMEKSNGAATNTKALPQAAMSRAPSQTFQAPSTAESARAAAFASSTRQSRPAALSNASSISTTAIESKVRLKETLRKPAPPPKPQPLRSVSSQPTKSVPPPPPEARRKAHSTSTPNGTPKVAPLSRAGDQMSRGPAPAPPPRNQGAVAVNVDSKGWDIMDNDEVEGLTDWEPLRPL